jgi:small GTP-binding protein
MIDIISRKIVAVGDGAVGKTALLVTYASNVFPVKYIPTVFDNYTAGTEFRGEKIIVNIWDTAGQEEYARLRSLSYPETDVFLICFDVGTRSSFANLHSWFTEVKHHQPEGKVLMVGTKVDRRKEVPNAVTEEEALTLVNKIKADGYVECSAMFHQGVSEVFEQALSLTNIKSQKKILKRTQSCQIL